jgi:hypothetical protein
MTHIKKKLNWLLVLIALACTPAANPAALHGVAHIGGHVGVGTLSPAIGSLPIPTGSQTNGIDSIYALPYYLTTDAGPVTVKFSNRALLGGGSGGGIGNSISVNIAPFTSDGTGLPTGNPLAGPWLAQTVPGNGTELNIGTFTPVRGADGKIVLVFSVPAGTAFAIGGGQSYGVSFNGTTTIFPLPGSWTGGTNPLAEYWISLSFQTSRRRIVVHGDSISQGAPGPGFEGSAWYQLGPKKDLAMLFSSAGGSGLTQRVNPGTYPELFTDWTIEGNDHFIECLVNSLAGGVAQFESKFTTFVNYLRTNGAVHIYSQTVAPQSAIPGVETVRTTVNAWLLANSLGLDGVVDIDLALRDPSAPTQLLPAYDVGDHLHWTAAGHNAAYAVIQPIVAPRLPPGWLSVDHRRPWRLPPLPRVPHTHRATFPERRPSA